MGAARNRACARYYTVAAIVLRHFPLVIFFKRIFRLYRMHAMHEMPSLVTDVRVSVRQSFRLSVCHAAQLGFTVQKRQNGSKCCLGRTLLGAHGPDAPTVREGTYVYILGPPSYLRKG